MLTQSTPGNWSSHICTDQGKKTLSTLQKHTSLAAARRVSSTWPWLSTSRADSMPGTPDSDWSSQRRYCSRRCTCKDKGHFRAGTRERTDGGSGPPSFDGYLDHDDALRGPVGQRAEQVLIEHGQGLVGGQGPLKERRGARRRLGQVVLWELDTLSSIHSHRTPIFLKQI